MDCSGMRWGGMQTWVEYNRMEIGGQWYNEIKYNRVSPLLPLLLRL